MKVSIVIPCYNEKDTMKKIVEAVPNTPLTYREIIVVDDCSEDRTQTLLRDKLSHVIDRVIYHSVNRGTSPLLHRCGASSLHGHNLWKEPIESVVWKLI